MKLLVHQRMKRRAAESPVDKIIRKHFIHCLSEVSSVPVDVLGRVRARTGGRRTAGVENVEIVGPTSVPTARLVQLLKPVFVGVLPKCQVGIVIVGVNYDGLWVLVLEGGELGLEGRVVGGGEAVHGGYAAHLVSVFRRRKHEGVRCATGWR